MCQECVEETKVCKICGKEKPVSDFHKDVIKNNKQKYKNRCNVCNAKLKRNILYNDVFTEEVVDIILDSILNEKVKIINELSMLINIDLDLLLPFIKSLNIRSKPIKIGFSCPTCGKESSKIISQFEKHKDNYCSKECYDISQSMEVLMFCKWCGKEFNKTPLKGQENYFCCHDCSVKYHAQERTKPLVINVCENCGQEYEVKEYDAKDRRFCSNKCVGEYFTGENNVRYVERLIVECDWCKKEFEETENGYNQSIKHFCSNDCRNTYHKEVTQKTEEYKQRARETSVKNLVNGLIPQTNSRPQTIINKLLDELHIKYDNEYDCKYYAIDNYLTDFNLMIEIQGGFWHCDNRRYEEINSIIQVECIKKDKSKKTYLKNYYNIDVLYLWEDDINNNLDLCRKLILEYINNKGVLQDYHSFNYYLEDNNMLSINNNIIVPYMDYDINDLNKIIDLSIRELKSRYEPDKHIIFNCEYCGKPSSSFIDHYNETEHHFCSRKCNASYYGDMRQKSKQICKVCGNNTPNKNGLCKVCEFKKERALIYTDKWTEEITDLILNNVIYKKIKFLNELEDIMHIPLKEILKYMIKTLRLITKLRVKRICEHCGVEFTLPPSRIVDGKDKYCSKECSQLSQRNKIILNCECCGKEIERTPSQFEKSKNHFCSNKCADNWRKENYVSTKVTKVCQICGIEYQVDQCRAETSVACSRECQGKWQSINLVGENANGYNHDWSEEDRTFKCEWCGLEYQAKPYQIENGRRFCSKECKIEWWSKVFIVKYKNQ